MMPKSHKKRFPPKQPNQVFMVVPVERDDDDGDWRPVAGGKALLAKEIGSAVFKPDGGRFRSFCEVAP